MCLFIDILLIIFDCDIQFARTKSQPLIPYQSVIQPNSFKSQCKHFIEFYDIIWDQTDIIPSKINRIYQKDKKRSKKIYDTFIESLKKLQILFLKNKSYPFYKINSMNNINNNYINNDKCINIKNETKYGLNNFENKENCQIKHNLNDSPMTFNSTNSISNIITTSIPTTYYQQSQQIKQFNEDQTQIGNNLRRRNNYNSNFSNFKPEIITKTNNSSNYININNNNHNTHIPLTTNTINPTNLMNNNNIHNNNNNNNHNFQLNTNLINSNNLLLVPVGNINTTNINIENRVNSNQISSQSQQQSFNNRQIVGYQFLSLGDNIMIAEYKFTPNPLFQ